MNDIRISISPSQFFSESAALHPNLMTSASSSSLWSLISSSPSLHRVGWCYIIANLLPCLCLFCISLSLLLPRYPSLGWCYITILRPWWRHRSNAGSGGKFYAGLKLFLETTSKSSKLSQNIFNINITITRIKIKLFLKQHQHYQNQNPRGYIL